MTTDPTDPRFKRSSEVTSIVSIAPRPFDHLFARVLSKHQSRDMLGRYSAVEVGRAFEFHCVRYLNTQLHMSLIRTGKAGDEGIDVQGSWYLPAVGDAPESSTAAAVRRMKVVGQCKALAKPLGGIAIRELEGVLGHLRGQCGVFVLARCSVTRSDAMDTSAHMF